MSGMIADGKEYVHVLIGRVDAGSSPDKSDKIAMFGSMTYKL